MLDSRVARANSMQWSAWKNIGISGDGARVEQGSGLCCIHRPFLLLQKGEALPTASVIGLVSRQELSSVLPEGTADQTLNLLHTK